MMLTDKELKQHQQYFNKLIKNQEMNQLEKEQNLYYNVSIAHKEWTFKHLVSSIKQDKPLLFNYLIYTDMSDIMNECILSLLVKQNNPSYLQSFIDGNTWNWKKKNVKSSHIKHELDYYINDIFWKAISIGNIPVVQFCLDYGIPIYDNDYDNQPLDEAVTYQQKEMIDFLVSQGAPLDGQDFLALRNAFKQKDHTLFFHLLTLGTPLESHLLEDFFQKPIYSPTEKSHVSSHNYLNTAQQIFPYLTTEEQKHDLLIGAIAYKSLDAMTFLLEQHVNVFLHNSQCLRVAANMNHIPSIKLLMDYGANPDLILTSKDQYKKNVIDILNNYPRNKALIDRLNRELTVRTKEPKPKI